MKIALRHSARKALWTLSTALCLWTAPAVAETERMVDAADFIPAEHMQSAIHEILPQATTNGFSITYRINTPDGLQTVEGTQQALMRVREIHGTEILRDRSTVGTVFTSAKNRTLNLVETPVRILDSVGNEWAEVDSTEAAILFIPVQTGQLIGKFAQGVGEIGVTGIRIVKGAAGTRCSGVQCVTKLGEDAWSGLNSLTGKHDVTRRLHNELGTTTETTYQPLKNQVDRISYADAYTGTAYKFGLGVNGARVDYFSPVVTGTGYANNGEFLAAYQDADKIKNENKDRLREWGVSENTLKAFYDNPNFSKSRRIQLVTAVRQLGNPTEQARLIKGAARANSRFNADAHTKTYDYIAAMAQSGQYAGLLSGAPVAIAKRSDGTWIMPIVSDYLLPNAESLEPADMLSKAIQAETPGARGEIHVIGTASEAFINEARKRGLTTVIVPI